MVFGQRRLNAVVSNRWVKGPNHQENDRILVIVLLNFYHVLGVPENATKEQIKKAYREQIKFFHPDVFWGNPEVAKEKTIQLNAAYETLMNDHLRRVYDENLRKERQKEQEAAEKEQETAKEDPEESKEEPKREDPVGPERSCDSRQAKRLKRWRAAAIIFAALSFYACWKAENKANQLEASHFEEVNVLQNDLADRDEQIEDMEKSALQLRLRIYDLNQNIEELELWRDSVAYELEFWRDCAVIVTAYGEKYHTYGCQYIQGKSFWIYNTEAAISIGYGPCSVCDPPTR